MARTRLPLELNVEVTTAAGSRFLLGDNRSPTERLLSPVLTSEIGDGFKTAGGSLRRRYDIDYPDLNLVDTWTFTGADGSVAWEGRNAEMPRSLTDKSVINVSLAGWMAHARDRPFREIYVDRDLSAWTGLSLGRQSVLLAGGFTPTDAASASDVVGATAGMVTGFDGSWATGFKPVSEAWYDAGAGLYAAKVAYSWLNQNATTISAADTNWTWFVGSSTDDRGTSTSATSNLRAAGPSSGTFTPTTPGQYAFLELVYNSAPGGADGAHFGIAWYNLAVYGAHGLPTYSDGTGQPPGVLASDVIRDVASRFCPLLDTSGVKDTTFPIAHLVFKDLTDPYDAFLQVNKYHLWNLGVWENRRLVYETYDLSDYDWQIRAGEDGATFEAQGQTTDNVFNGVVVSYQDALTGKKNYLTPDVYPDLQSTDLLNPWSMHAINRWMKLDLSSPTTQAQALDVGTVALAEANRPKGPGTITVQGGYIKDRQGIEQPGWKPRAGERVAVTNHPNDAPRLIHGTTWDGDSHTLTLAVDAPPAMLDAYLDRQGTALTARGLA